MQRSLFLLVAVLTTSALSGSAAAEPIDYAKQIEPIFMEHCANCHGEKRGLGKLRLHTPEALQEKWNKDANLIVKGNAEKSELYERLVLPAGHKKLMPKKADPLSAENIKLIKQWIDQGAAFEVVAVKNDGHAEEHSEHDHHADGHGHGHSHAEAPAAIPLPEVAAADAAAIKQLTDTGAQVNPLFAGSSLLQVSYALRNEPATDAELAALAGVAEQVYELNLAKAQVSDKGLAVLAKLKNLSQLHLENSSVTDSGLSHLSGLERLQYLNLYGTQITDAGIKHLEGLKHLQKLYVWKTKVSYDAATAMEKNMASLTVSLGFDHPVVVRKRLTKQLKAAKSQAKEGEASLKKAQAAFERAKKEQEAAKKRLDAVQKELDILDGKVKPEEKKADQGEKKA